MVELMEPLTMMLYVLLVVFTMRNLWHTTFARDDFLRAARQPKALPQTATGNWEQLPNSPTLNALRSNYKADRIDLITFLSKWEETFKQRVDEIDDWQSIDPWTDRLEPASKPKKSTKIDKLPAKLKSIDQQLIETEDRLAKAYAMPRWHQQHHQYYPSVTYSNASRYDEWAKAWIEEIRCPYCTAITLISYRDPSERARVAHGSCGSCGSWL